MKRSIPSRALIESGIACACAVIVAIVLSATKNADHDLPRPLLTGPADALVIQHESGHFGLLQRVNEPW